MDDFLEGTFSEDSNGLDHGEAEAALYSLVHHSKDTYNTSMLEFNGGYIRQRNSASRWEIFGQIGDSVKPDNYIFHPQKIDQALDHIPFDDNNITSKSRTMFGQQFNKRGRNVNYNWNNHRNEKPWNVHDRIRNNYHRNRNLVPVFVQRNEVRQQYSVDPQTELKINNFSSFESPRSNFHDKIHHNEPNGEKAELVTNSGKTSGEGSVKNNISRTGQNGNMSDRTSSYYGVKIAGDYGASTSKEQNTFNIAEDCSNNTARKKSSSLPNHNSDISAVEKNATKIVEVTSVVAEDVVIISDTDGNEDCTDESIVEVCVPPKPSPPLVALESSDESESVVVSNESFVLNVSENSYKLAVDSPHSSQSTPGSSKSIKNPLFNVSSTSKEIKKKKKKRHKRINSFECKLWTAGMIQFYNKSWGGETYDHQKLQHEMTTNPSKWKILDVDKYGPLRDYGPFARVRCANCHQFGHMAKLCPDPKKIKCCSMCGERGHLENQCPNKICLKCGRPAPLFNEGCPSCWNHPQTCATCGGVDHFKWLCPDVWRKLHSVTTTEELKMGILEETTYKSSMELNCCFCAGKGHLAAVCPKGSKQTLPSPKDPSLNIFSTIKILNKKRKKKRSSFFDGKNNQQEFNRKRRKTN